MHSLGWTWEKRGREARGDGGGGLYPELKDPELEEEKEERKE